MSLFDVFAAVLLVVGAFILTCCVAGATQAAYRRFRAALADDPYDDSDKHRCPVCYDLDADEANGILRIDFELWESEPAHDPRV